MFYRTTFPVLAVIVALMMAAPTYARVTTVNGWYEGEEIYYIDQGIEEGVTGRGENDIYRRKPNVSGTGGGVHPR